MILSIRTHPTNRPGYPLIRQGLGPIRIHFVLGRVALGIQWPGTNHREHGGQCCRARPSHNERVYLAIHIITPLADPKFSPSKKKMITAPLYKREAPPPCLHGEAPPKSIDSIRGREQPSWHEKRPEHVRPACNDSGRPAETPRQTLLLERKCACSLSHKPSHQPYLLGEVCSRPCRHPNLK